VEHRRVSPARSSVAKAVKGTTRFANDLFISYAQIDNRPTAPDQLGWISRFQASLEALISMRLGRRVRIWRDQKLSGNDSLSESSIEQLHKTAIMVSVVTPLYVQSEWCKRELKEFCEALEASGGLTVERQSRLAKVLITPVDIPESFPSVLTNTLGYEFFTLEQDVPLQLDPAYGEKFAQEYNRKVAKLAWELSQMLNRLEANA